MIDLASNDFGPPHRVVDADRWRSTLAELKADGYTYFDWLSAVDETDGLRLVAHVVRQDPWDHLIVATFLAPGQAAQSVVEVYAGAAWHQRETHEMFGLAFGTGEQPAPLLLPDGFEGHPLRKDFVLAARVVKPWPGAKEPGESDHDLADRPARETGGTAGGTPAPRRRRVTAPGIPEDWMHGPDSATGGAEATADGDG